MNLKKNLQLIEDEQWTIPAEGLDHDLLTQSPHFPHTEIPVSLFKVLMLTLSVSLPELLEPTNVAKKYSFLSKVKRQNWCEKKYLPTSH